MWKDDPEYSFKQNLNSQAFLECVMELRSFLLFVSSSSLSLLSRVLLILSIVSITKQI